MFCFPRVHSAEEIGKLFGKIMSRRGARDREEMKRISLSFAKIFATRAANKNEENSVQ